jgi:hypothetical protein
MVAAIPAISVALVLAIQIFKPPVHTAVAAIAPTREAVTGLDGQLGGLSKLAAVAGVNVGSTRMPVGDFEKFRFLLFSSRLGEYQARTREILPLVFDEEWTGTSWQKPGSLVQIAKDLLYPPFGLVAWAPPDGRSLSRHYDEKLKVSELGESGIFQISIRDTDPDRAQLLLEWVIDDANELVRRDAQSRATKRADYLRQQIATAAVAEYRSNLADLLAKEEQTLMLASTSLPFAADMVQPVTIARNPGSQRPALFAAVAGVLGLSLSVFLALLLGPADRRQGDWNGKVEHAINLPGHGQDPRS